jgi:hypothetical protein
MKPGKCSATREAASLANVCIRAQRYGGNNSKCRDAL